MLEQKYVNDKIINLYEQYPVWSSAILISLGITRTFENEPSAIELHLEKELVIDEHTKLKSIPITTYNFDPTLAPEGKTCMRIILHTENYEYWKNLRENDHEKYKKEKERISNEVITILHKRFGNIIENVEVIDVATPSTFNRYTNNWKGRFMTWDWIGVLPVSINKQLPRLKNFYMIGHWVMAGGGIPCGLITGRDIVRIICHKDRKKFKVQ
jgi:phytoene dehydrogenase-like protein